MSDLISREQAIQLLGDAHFPNYGTAIMVIMDVPPAEPERKKGKWKTVPWKIIEHGEVVVVGDAQCCSVCRHAEKGWKKEMKYCPNCGSEMSRGE